MQASFSPTVRGAARSQVHCARNPAFWWLVAAALGALLAVIYVPSLGDPFRFSPPNSAQLAVAVAAAIGALAGHKLLGPAVARMIRHVLTASGEARN